MKVYGKSNSIHFPSTLITLHRHDPRREPAVFQNNIGIWHDVTVHLGNTF